MKYGLQLVTSPQSEPVSLIEAKAHLRVDFADEDDNIQGLIYAAREVVEGKLRRAVFEQTYEMTLDQFPYPSGLDTKTPEQRDGYLFPSLHFTYFAIELPRSKVTSVDAITFKPSPSADAVTLDPAFYAVDTNSEPARIVPVAGATWPYVGSYMPGSITIAFKAGQWDSDSVPQSIKHAMLLLIGHWYANREAVSGKQLSTMPLAVDALLERWVFYGA